jgi:hypothetical protein
LKEKKMKNAIFGVTLVLALLLAPPSLASVRVFNSSGTQLGTYTDLKFSNGLSTNQVSGKAQIALTPGDGTTALSGFLQTQTAVSGDLLASQCGSTVTADNSELYNLPTISASTLGCRFTFIHGASSASGGTKRLTVNPQNANQILLLTNSAGDAVTADVVGNSLVLEAIAPGWAPVGSEKGSWFDAN